MSRYLIGIAVVGTFVGATALLMYEDPGDLRARTYRARRRLVT